MTVQLVVLRGMPDDEIEEIRELLAEHHIDSYETPDDNWGVAMPAIWLRDETQLERARSLLADYQQQRAERARAAYRMQVREGTAPTFLDRARQQPLRLVIYLAVMVLVLYLSTMPFLDLGDW